MGVALMPQRCARALARRGSLGGISPLVIAVRNRLTAHSVCDGRPGPGSVPSDPCSDGMPGTHRHPPSSDRPVGAARTALVTWPNHQSVVAASTMFSIL